MEPTAQTGLSVTHLIGNASMPVKVIMAILFLMFLSTLYLTGKKYVQFIRLRRKNREFDQTFWSGSDLEILYTKNATPKASNASSSTASANSPNSMATTSKTPTSSSTTAAAP